MSMVNVIIELEGELELRGNMAVLEMNLELPKSFYMICKLRTWVFPRPKKIKFFFYILNICGLQ